MPRHARDRVVEYDHRRVRLIVSDVRQPRHARMHKRRVADHRDGFRFRFATEHLVETMRGAYRRAHAQRHFDRRERRHRAQSITADIAEHRALALFERIEQSAMRTARAHHRRTHGDFVIEFHSARNRATEGFSDHVLRELIDHGQEVFALDRQAERTDMRFDDRIELLNHDQPLDLRREIFDQLDRQRIDQPEFQHARLVAEHLFDVLITRRRCDDPELRRAPLDPIERRGLRILDQLLRPRLDDRVTALRIARHHDVLRDVLLILLDVLNAFARLDDRLRMSHARAHLYDDGRIELL